MKNLMIHGIVGGGALVLMTSCQLFSTIEPYTNTVSTQSLVIGMVNPLEDYIDLDDQLLLTAFVSDAAEIANIEDAPITGAKVGFSSTAAQGDLAELEDGLYFSVLSAGDLTYEEGAVYQIQAEASAETYISEANAPAPASFEEAGTCVSPGEGLTLHINGGTYKRLLAAVFDEEGNTTWSNIPETTDEIVSFISADDAGPTLELPGSAFPEGDTIYGVVVAGINEGGSYSDNLNPLLSRFFVGGGELGVIGTFSLAELCENLPK